MVINIKNIIKRSYFEGKNEIGEKNEIRNSVIGFGTYFGANNKIDALKIGKYCSVASNLEIVCGFHPLKKMYQLIQVFIQQITKIKIKYNYVM